MGTRHLQQQYTVFTHYAGAAAVETRVPNSPSDDPYGRPLTWAKGKVYFSFAGWLVWIVNACLDAAWRNQSEAGKGGRTRNRVNVTEVIFAMREH